MGFNILPNPPVGVIGQHPKRTNMSKMEPEATEFLKRIVWSLSSGLVWLFFNIGFGIYKGWMVPEHGLQVSNIIFYAWMIISLALLIWINYRIWRKKFPHG